MSFVRSLDRSFSFAPSGLDCVPLKYPRLAPWAAFFRRFAAAFSHRRRICGQSFFRAEAIKPSVLADGLMLIEIVILLLLFSDREQLHVKDQRLSWADVRTSAAVAVG